MVTLSSVRLSVVEPRRRMRTWLPPATRSVWLNRWTTQNPSMLASVVSVPGGAVNAAVNTIVAGALADAADMTSRGWLFSTPPPHDGLRRGAGRGFVTGFPQGAGVRN